MKKLILSLLILSYVGFTFAQEDEEKMQTLISSKPTKIRGYIGPLMSFSTIDGEFAYMTGFIASGIFNDHWLFGVYNLAIETPMYSNNDNYLGAEMNYDQRGLTFGYVFMPKSVVHFTANLYAGKANLEVYNDLLDEWIDDNIVFTLNPMIEAEINVARFLRIGVGAHYNFAFDVDQINGYTDEDFSGLGGSLSFKFGWYK